MSEILDEYTASQDLNDRIESLLDDLELDDATEVTLEDKDGGRYWLRFLDGYVQAVTCRLPVETQFESEVQVYWNITPNTDGAMMLTESMHLAGLRPDDPDARFTVLESEEIDFVQAYDLVEDLLRSAEVVETDIDDQPAPPVKTSRLQAFMQRIVVTSVLSAGNFGPQAVSTGVAIVTT